MTLSGGYGVQRNGRSTGGFVSAIGVVTFDGEGKISGRQTVSANGTFTKQTIEASYTVNDDCTGTITNASGDSMKIMINHDADEVLGMSLTPGSNESVHFERVADHRGHEAACTLETFSGTYGFLRNGHVPSGDLLAIGYTVVDGRGNFCCGGQTIDKGGTFSFATNPGKYTLAPDCMGAQYDQSGSQFSEFVMIHGGSEAIGMSETSGNNVVVHFERVNDLPADPSSEGDPRGVRP